MRQPPPAPAIFITGTDTGVGKTVLTAQWLHALRRGGLRVRAMKPFCSGGREDVELLQALQPGELPDDLVNPFYFRAALAPRAAAGRARNQVSRERALAAIESMRAAGGDGLLVEGAGGVLVPLGPGYTVLDLIADLPCRPVVVARNRLGTINHTALTVRALVAVNRPPLAIVLMAPAEPDLAARTNARLLAELLPEVPLLPFPYLGPEASDAAGVRRHHPRCARILGRLTRLAGWDK